MDQEIMISGAQLMMFVRESRWERISSEFSNFLSTHMRNTSWEKCSVRNTLCRYRYIIALHTTVEPPTKPCHINLLITLWFNQLPWFLFLLLCNRLQTFLISLIFLPLHSSQEACREIIQREIRSVWLEICPTRRIFHDLTNLFNGGKKNTSFSTTSIPFVI